MKQVKTKLAGSFSTTGQSCKNKSDKNWLRNSEIFCLKQADEKKKLFTWFIFHSHSQERSSKPLYFISNLRTKEFNKTPIDRNKMKWPPAKQADSSCLTEVAMDTESTAAGFCAFLSDPESTTFEEPGSGVTFQFRQQQVSARSFLKYCSRSRNRSRIPKSEEFPDPDPDLKILEERSGIGVWKSDSGHLWCSAKEETKR